MFSLNKSDQTVIIQIKIKDIERDLDYSPKDKEQITRYYKKQLAELRRKKQQ